jgi:hypothetical protein
MANAQQTTAGTGDKKFEIQLKKLNEEAKAEDEAGGRKGQEGEGRPRQGPGSRQGQKK